MYKNLLQSLFLNFKYVQIVLYICVCFVRPKKIPTFTQKQNVFKQKIFQTGGTGLQGASSNFNLSILESVIQSILSIDPQCKNIKVFKVKYYSSSKSPYLLTSNTSELYRSRFSCLTNKIVAFFPTQKFPKIT